MKSRDVLVVIVALLVGGVIGYFVRSQVGGLKPALTESTTDELLEFVPKDANFAALMAVREPIGPMFTALMGLPTGGDDAEAFEADLRAFLLKYIGADLSRAKDAVGFFRVHDEAVAAVVRGDTLWDVRDQKTIGSGRDQLIVVPQDNGALLGNASGVAMFESRAAITNDAPHKSVAKAVKLVGNGDMVFAAHLGEWQDQIERILPGVKLDSAAIMIDFLGGVTLGVVGPQDSLKKLEERMRQGLAAAGLYVLNARMGEKDNDRMEEAFGMLMTDYLVRAVKANLTFDYSGDSVTIRMENPNSNLQATQIAALPILMGVLATTGVAAFERYIDASRQIEQPYDYDNEVP